MTAARASGPVLLLVAKAPVPGEAKTRLARDIGDEAAADMAAAALLDTLDVVRQTQATSVVALTGDLGRSARRDAVELALAEHRVIDQRGIGLGERLVNAHADAAAVAEMTAVVQVGMDTPQLTVLLLRAAINSLEDTDAAMGPATDGGWWCLAVRDAAFARCLAGVPMSRADTGLATYDALLQAGARTVSLLPRLRDVDTLSDAVLVARDAPESRFAAAVDAYAAVPGAGDNTRRVSSASNRRSL